MNKNTMRLYLIILATIFTVRQSTAETHVSGAVSGTWTPDNSPYIADAAISVSQSDTLIIEPGVSVIFTGRFGLSVSGILIAEGGERDSIFFNARDHQPDAWIGIEFNGMRSGYSRLAFCSISYGYRGIIFNGAHPSVTNSSFVYHENNALRFEGSRARVENCSISNINGTGIAILEQSRPTVQGCTISDCGNNGISVSEGSGPIIIGNNIRDITENGISLNDADACSLRSNMISHVDLRGVWINQSSDVILLRNVIDACGREGCWIYRSEDITL
ncbi:MAG TPA: right-handed parallel beta-helix repeat-containing protein, partial [Bacteroidetes bacterium]|nr:right-handed parallel beta-helix repeat-containing protein [Bacteroidota bacterium]